MKKLALMLFAALFTIAAFAQNDPISVDRRRKGIDTFTQLQTQYKQATSSDTLRTSTPKGKYTKNSRTNKVTSFVGQGKNNAGQMSLFDSSGNNYLVVMDSTGKWFVDSYRPVSISIRHVRAIGIDTTNNKVTIDSTLQANNIVLGSASQLKTGTGSPETVVTAPIGSLYLRTDGSTTTTLYIKTSGTGNTGWTAK